MFVPVNCTKCGKPFQVPEAALGKLAPCPWCQEVVTALPVSVPQPDGRPATAPEPPKPAASPPEPLPLDDAPVVAQKPARARPIAPPASRKRPKFPLATIAIGLAVVAVVMGGTVLALGFRSGRFSSVESTEFTPPDGSFTVALPGQPAETDLEPVPEGSLRGGKRYAVRRWYARTAAWVSYHDLDPELVKKLPSDKDRVIAAGVLRVAREREAARLQGIGAKEAEVRLDSGWGVEVQFDTPDEPAVVRLILMGEGKNPRLYVVGVQGKNLTPTSPACSRLFTSFRVNN